MVAVVKEISNEWGPWIITYSGHKFYFGQVFDATIDIVDIAHALSLTCRFSGHCKQYYSVAEHSVLVSSLCDNPLEGLLHDASEAYMADLNSPLKSLLKDYKDIENRVQGAICARYGISYPLSENLHDCDTAQLKTEARNLLTNYEWVKNYPTKRKFGIVPACLSPTKAEKLFLDTFKELSRGS